VTSSGQRQTKTVYQSDQLDVRTIDEPIRGHLQHLEWVGRPTVVLAVPYMPDGRLVLVRQYRSSIDGYTLEFPAGKVDPGENPRQALERELREEAGYWVHTALHMGALLTAPHFSDETLLVYLTTGEVKTKPHPAAKEQLTVELVPPAAIDDLISSHELVDSKSLAALLLCPRRTTFDE
jgi:ADP-ribose pyrophosphatase